jgi:hypothetical protein
VGDRRIANPPHRFSEPRAPGIHGYRPISIAPSADGLPQSLNLYLHLLVTQRMTGESLSAPGQHKPVRESLAWPGLCRPSVPSLAFLLPLHLRSPWFPRWGVGPHVLVPVPVPVPGAEGSEQTAGLTCGRGVSLPFVSSLPCLVV